ncbi:UDP-N-acetylenolpyruvoylglucosamine reductase [Helicobacter monodelphidis]|uniref:UDP-N-acetylmuramate dehydrogenase n=1 Tax=Helicobacter sp. 15-1451 TaxID=2004995 RepID=UPI000DCDBE85|nr:UDP-N-acetylmuramate dehydrogenase [Helicobacter sp. 15-1451]RAX58220.1 UDP-N-acetylenolpyruvoylglucosamine reductase [Helicobacter sp. 15-1451]
MKNEWIEIDFSRYTSIRIGAKHSVEVIHSLTPKENRQILGHGFNLLVAPSASHLAILGQEFSTIEELPHHLLRVGANLSGPRLFSYAKKHNLNGFEMLSHLPGSVGGLITMNAGMSLQQDGQLKRYEISQILEGIYTQQGFIHSCELEFDYRYSNIPDIIYYAVFRQEKGLDETLIKHFQAIRKRQPKEPSCGSAFKNPQGDFAGRLIESVNLKGVHYGDMCFSPQHANFLINCGRGTFEEADSLLKEAQRRVFQEYGISLEKEVVIIQ